MDFYSKLLAQVTNPAFSSSYGGNGWGYFNVTIQHVINVGFLIAGIIFVIIFIIGAFQWITSGGDKVKLAEAKGKITHVIIGLIILLLIFMTIQFVNYVLGINIGMFGRPAGSVAYDTGPPATAVPTIPINTLAPTNTPGGIGLPTGTNTPIPTATPTRIPVPTRPPTSTPTPLPTNTPVPTATNTPLPTSTNTPVPTATNTPLPTSTNTPVPTSTPLPTATPTPLIAFCSDTDAGVDPMNIGTVSENTSSGTGAVSYHTDFCLSLSDLNEFSCGNSSSFVSSSISCLGISSGGYVCQNGECCGGPSASCTSNSDCCLPYACAGGVCQSSSNVLLNQGMNLSCRNYCLNRGFSGCTSIGTNALGDNGMAEINSGGVCTATNTYDCYTVIYNSGLNCGGLTSDWTFCNCY